MQISSFTRNIVIFPICALLILYAVFIDIASDAASLNLPLHPFVDFFLFDFTKNKYVKDLIIALSFSMLIAKIVAVTVEKASRKEQEKVNQSFLAKQEDFFRIKTDAIAKAVFEGIYGIGFKSDYVDEVVKTVFESPLFREECKSVYRLKDCPGNDGIILNTFIKYVVKNNGKKAEIFHPYIKLDAIKTKSYINNTQILSYKIGSQEKITNEHLSSFKDQLNAKTTNKAEITIDEIKLDPGDTLEIEICYNVFKEFSDNEIHQMIVPSSGFDIEVKNETSGEFSIGGNSIHREELEEQSFGITDKEIRWVLPYPTLPHHGYIIYWQPHSLIK